MAIALEIQREHLAKWKTVLNEKAYELLSKHVMDLNFKGYASPYDVCRGQDLTEFVLNLHLD